MSSGIEKIDAVYVLTVKTFSDRIAHVTRELARHQIEFEFIFDYDACELTDADLSEVFVPGQLTLPACSLVLKHAQAWRLALARGQQRILVLEDDVVLAQPQRFRSVLAAALDAAAQLAPGYLIFLGGADTRVPDAFFSATGALFPLPLPTTEAYISDAAALRQRLEWLATHRVNLPADHLINQIDRDCGIAQFWLREPIVEQGSVFGLFDSKLDNKRMKQSLLFNRMRYHFMKFRRRRLRGWLVRLSVALASTPDVAAPATRLVDSAPARQIPRS